MNELPSGRMVQAGLTSILEDECDPTGAHYSYERALVLVFETDDDLRAALREMKCAMHFGERAAQSQMTTTDAEPTADSQTETKAVDAAEVAGRA